MKSKLDNETQYIDGEKVEVYRSLLKIVAQLHENQYTEVNSTQNRRQVAVVEHNDLSNPASDRDTSQG